MIRIGITVLIFLIILLFLHVFITKNDSKTIKRRYSERRIDGVALAQRIRNRKIKESEMND